MNYSLKEPLDLVKSEIGKKVLVKLRGNRELQGKLNVNNINIGL
jgi:small nuclear ribonucleoprotein (snRNP)-like protein